MRHYQCGERTRDRQRTGGGLGAPRDRDRRHDHERECDQRNAIMLAHQHQCGGGEQIGGKRAG